MIDTELDSHLTEQGRLDDLEEARLLPIYKAQREVLDGFCIWLNDNHPTGTPFQVLPKPSKTSNDMKPWLDGVNDAFECIEETEEIGIDPDDAYAYSVLWNLYQKRQ